MTRSLWMCIALLMASTVSAQKPREHAMRARATREVRVPEAYAPPAGLCRLWLDGVPASQQPAPTDCASVIRNRPANAAVVFGPQVRSGASEMPAFSNRGPMLMMRQPAPGAGKFVRDDGPDGTRDSAVKSAPRKPENPQ